MQLSKRAILAGGWTFGGHIASQCLRFGSNLLMTRLLAPEYFGVMALALTFVFAMTMMSDLGLHQLVTSSPRGGDADFLSVVWAVEMLRGLLIFVLGVGVAVALPWAGARGWLGSDTTYAHPDLPLALGLIALSFLITSTTSLKLVTRARQLLVQRVIAIDLGSQVVGLGVMIVWALRSPDILALALGTIASALAKSLLSHLAVPGERSRARWDTAIFWEIFGFGRWIFLSSILGFLVLSLDKVILGGQLDATTFGVYTIAMMLMMAPYEVVQRIVTSVMFPALSEVARSRPDEVGSIYYRMRLPIDLAAAASAALLFAFGDDIVRLLYDSRYEQAGPTLEVLALGIPMVGIAAASQIYMAIGRPWLVSGLMLPRLVTLAIGLPLLTSAHGLPGAAWAVVLSQWSGLPFVVWTLARHRMLSWRGEARFVLFIALSFGLSLGLAALWRASLPGTAG